MLWVVKGKGAALQFLAHTTASTIRRTLSGTLKSTPTEWLPVLFHIVPPSVEKIKNKLRSPINKVLNNPTVNVPMLTPSVLGNSRGYPRSWHRAIRMNGIAGYNVKNRCPITNPNSGGSWLRPQTVDDTQPNPHNGTRRGNEAVATSFTSGRRGM